MWIPWIAKEAKIYERNGLDFEIVLLRGSGQSSQALLSGGVVCRPRGLAAGDACQPERRRYGQRSSHDRFGGQQIAGSTVQIPMFDQVTKTRR
jgi:hypothetical protein